MELPPLLNSQNYLNNFENHAFSVVHALVDICVVVFIDV